ncbi:hypothetical protein V492_04679 [Pseudogymnoascus sp. VKM F-4246]|nr:hypothetical protein V492_04679 [Pseudogymnoascus sp. VKM F-4246]
MFFTIMKTIATTLWKWMLQLDKCLATRIDRGKAGSKRHVYNDIDSLKALDPMHETVLAFRNMVVQEGAGSWATIPVVRDAQAEAVVNFPSELDMPWKFLQRVYGCTADSGNNTANVLHNFDKNGRWTLWINNGVSEKIRSTELGFFKIFYEVEVKALPVYLEIIQSIVAYDAGDLKACSRHLCNMSPLLRELFQEFYQGITIDKVSKDLWLRYCQGFQGWGVGSEVAGQYVRYNGLSGNQVLVFHVLDAFLDLPSYLSIEDTVRYIPVRQRYFTSAVRRHSFRSRIGTHSDPAVHEAFTCLISQMRLFRAAHKHRVMPYLKVPAPEREYQSYTMTSSVAYTVEDAAYPFTIRGMDWKNYGTYRPMYPSSMWATWLDYHEQHGGLLHAAHDIGAGSGFSANILSHYFSHVYVSDPGEGNIAAARKLLRPASRFSFTQKPGEARWLQEESVDFASICIAIHWMDAEQVLSNVAASLRPGGTLAICAYSFLVNFPGCHKLETLWAETMRNSVKGFVERGCVGADELKGMRKFLVGLDGTPVNAALYTDISRLQVNMRKDEAMPFCFVPHDFLELPESKVRPNEDVRYMQDEEWRMEVDVPWLKGYLHSSNMPFNDEVWNSGNWKELEHIISHELGGKVVVEWPVAMILATKNVIG